MHSNRSELVYYAILEHATQQKPGVEIQLDPLDYLHYCFLYLTMLLKKKTLRVYRLHVVQWMTMSELYVFGHKRKGYGFYCLPCLVFDKNIT